MEEAKRLRREADKEGLHVYIHKPNIRGRPNSRFLTATVLGIEQANRAAQVNEMWRARKKEIEFDAKQKTKSICSTDSHRRTNYLNKFNGSKGGEHSSVACSSVNHGMSDSIHECSLSRQRDADFYSNYDCGLEDEDVEEFLHSRAKRGRGSIGCRMDERGPYLPSKSSAHEAGNVNPNPKFGHGQSCRIKSSPLNEAGQDVDFKDIWPNKSTKHHPQEKKLKHKTVRRKHKESKH
ncbi:hypothetical protein HPP92_025257 [Vanilla planifolia]|uniref:Uncharacterized protein n=1 Tax=Vanilla planifolia TaxID=51239 RepID=A0A835PH75_VANPL|nr:hypothetical protein HPP92_025257 [Vanilla planifolia]